MSQIALTRKSTYNSLSRTASTGSDLKNAASRDSIDTKWS